MIGRGLWSSGRGERELRQTSSARVFSISLGAVFLELYPLQFHDPPRFSAGQAAVNNSQHTFTNLTSPLCRHFTSHPAVQSHNGSPPSNNQGPPPPHQQTPPSGSHHGHSPSGPYPHPKTPPHRPLRLPPIQSPHLLLLWRTY